MSMDLKILSKLIKESNGFLIEAEDEEVTEPIANEPKADTFEEDPMGFILRKYVSLNGILSELMTPDFRDYVEAIFIVAPKPTTFKVLLHNGQYFFLTYLGKAYEATVAGHSYYLIEIGEKERCMMAISRALRFGSPLKTKGPEGAEQGTRDEEGGGEEDTTASEEGGEELTEDIQILKQIIKKQLMSEAEGEQKVSVLFETALVIAWYKINKKKVPESAVSAKEVEQINSQYPELIKKAQKALIDTKLTGGSEARSTGKLSEPLTPFWKSYGATNKTSKSDVIIGDTRISVKAGPSQLMSGVKEEATATFYAALKKTPELLNSKEVQAILANIEKFAKSGRTQGNIRQAIKVGKDKQLLIANAANKKAMALLQNFFDTNPAFAQAFAIEAMSGEQKFGPDSPACAEYILYVDKNYENAKLNKIKNKSYASKIASQMKVDVRFKTGSVKSGGEKTGEYGYATVLGLQSAPEKAAIKEDNSQSLFKNIWNKITSSVSSLINFFIGNSENVDVEVEDDNIDFS